MNQRSLKKDLERAVVWRLLEKVQDCLDKGADVNDSHGERFEGETHLHFAVHHGYFELVRLLLKRKDIDTNKGNRYGDTPLHFAARYGSHDIAKLLLERTDIDPNKVNKYGDTPLHFAARYGSHDIAKLLLERTDIDPNKVNKYGNTPLHFAVRYGSYDIVKLLLERTDIIDPNKVNKDGNIAFDIAVESATIEIVKLLFGRSTIDPKKVYKDGNTVLHKAAIRGELKLFQWLLKTLNIDPNKKNKYGNTPLHFAVQYGSHDIVKLLLERTDIDPNKVNKNGNIAFDIAVESATIEIVKLLFKRSNIDPKKLYKDGNTVLHIAAIRGELKLVQWLLVTLNVDPNQKNKDGYTPFDLAAEEDRIDIVKLFLEKTPLYPIRIYKDGNTFFHKAAREGDLELVKLLLEISNIDLNQKNTNGNTPFDLAAEENRFDIVKLLFEKTIIDPIRVYKDGNTVLHKAASKGEIELVKLLLELSNIDQHQKNTHGENILQLAVNSRHVGLVRFILERTKIDPTANNQNGNSLLHTAVRDENMELVKLLLERTKINPAELNKAGENLLHLAVRVPCKSMDLVKLLLERTKIDTTEKDLVGDNLLHSAVRRNNIKLVRLLLERTQLDPAERNKNGYTPFDIFEQKQKKEDEFGEGFGVDKMEDGFDGDFGDEYGKTREEEKGAVKQLFESYMTRDTSTNLQEDEQLQDTYENDGVNPDDLLPFAGTSEEFSKLLSTGTYESFENRVFLCGSCACGKSTLASVLIGSPIPLTWKSTDGLVIHFGRNGINLETFEMVPLNGEDRGQQVLTKVVIGKPTRETSTFQSSDTQHVVPNAPSPKGTDNIESNLQTIKKEDSNSCKVSQSSDASLTESKDLPNTTSSSERKKLKSISLQSLKKIEAYAVHDDILKEVKSGQYKIKIAPSDLVDFGGQRSYDMTHQLFVQHGGTFVIMFDGSRDFHESLKEYPTGDISNECIVRHWVNSILTYCVDDSDVMPMIVFAATHSDLLPEDLKNKIKIDLVKKVTDMFGSHERKKHFVFDPVFFINGTDQKDQEIQNLKNKLVSIARNQPSWGLRRPMIWVPLELLISNMKKDNVNIIFKSHLADANKMNGDLALSDKRLEDFLLTQHALGKIMYFNQPELNNFVILYPPALVNILRSFITDEMFWPEDQTLRKILRKMTETGKIYKKDLLKLWKQKRFQTHIPDDDFKEFVIQVLIHLDVLVLPKRYSDKSDAHLDYYLVPCTVKEKMPMSFLDDKSFANRTLSLVYRLHQSSIPSALSFKLIGAVSSIWPIMESNGRPLLYHSSAVLSVDGNTEFRMIVEDTKVIVYLTHMSSKSSISPDIAASIQECLTATLEVVLKFYLSTIGKGYQMANLANLFHIEVGEVCGRSPCTVSISKAKLNSGWVCDSGNEHSSRYPLLWVFNKSQEECPSTCPGLANTILPTSPSELHLSRFADQLSNNSCKELLIHLGLQLKDWEDIEDCYRGMSLIIRIMALHCWKTTKIKGKPKKSFSNLLDALTAIGDERHLLCKVFRDDTDLLDFADTRLQKVPADSVLNGLPRNLGNCAIQLGIELGITMSSINETMVRHHKDMYSQIYDILRKWKSAGEIKPTIYRLMLALERVDIGGLDYLKNVYLGQ